MRVRVRVGVGSGEWEEKELRSFNTCNIYELTWRANYRIYGLTTDCGGGEATDDVAETTQNYPAQGAHGPSLARSAAE